MMKKNYLFILGSYYPNPSANGICIENIIKELLDEGNRVYVICEDVSHLRMSDPVLYDHVQITLVQTRKINRIRIHNKKVRGLCANLLILLHYFSWPVTSKSVIKKFNKAAYEICSNVNISSIICVVNPIESLVAGYYIHNKFPNIKLVYYFLDAFFYGKKPRWMNKNLYNKKTINFANNFFSEARNIVFMKSHKIPSNIVEKYESKISYLDIPLISENYSNNKANLKLKEDCSNKIYKVVYVGNFVKQLREPDNFLNFFLKLDKIGVDFKLEVYGNLKELGIDKKYSALQNKGVLTLNGFITHSEAIERVTSADIVVNVGASNTSFIPSKLFEYFSLKKPVLNFSTSPTDPTNEYLQKYGYFYTVVQNEIPEDYQYCLELLDSYNFDLMNYNVSKIFPDNTPKKFISEILSD